MEEVYPPSIDDLVEVGLGLISKQELYGLELTVMKVRLLVPCNFVESWLEAETRHDKPLG